VEKRIGISDREKGSGRALLQKSSSPTRDLKKQKKERDKKREISGWAQLKKGGFRGVKQGRTGGEEETDREVKGNTRRAKKCGGRGKSAEGLKSDVLERGRSADEGGPF